MKSAEWNHVLCKKCAYVLQKVCNYRTCVRRRHPRMSVGVDCSGELNPIVSPTESSRVGQLGPSPLLVALLLSPGRGSSGDDCPGLRPRWGSDKVLSPCLPNEPAGNGSQLWLSGEARRVGEALVEAPRGRRACRCPGVVGLVDAREKCLSGSPRRE